MKKIIFGLIAVCQLFTNNSKAQDKLYPNAFQITEDEKQLVAAKRFSHQALLNPLPKGIDNLDNKHVNTQIPKFVGFARIAELTQDNTGGWNTSQFQEVDYEIPDSMIKEKKQIRIKFQALPENTSGAVYYIRLVKR